MIRAAIEADIVGVVIILAGARQGGVGVAKRFISSTFHDCLAHVGLVLWLRCYTTIGLGRIRGRRHLCEGQRQWAHVLSA